MGEALRLTEKEKSITLVFFFNKNITLLILMFEKKTGAKNIGNSCHFLTLYLIN